MDNSDENMSNKNGRSDFDRASTYEKYQQSISREIPGKPMPRHEKYGDPSPLNQDRIPTYKDLVCAYLWTQTAIRQSDMLS